MDSLWTGIAVLSFQEVRLDVVVQRFEQIVAVLDVNTDVKQGIKRVGHLGTIETLH